MLPCHYLLTETIALGLGISFSPINILLVAQRPAPDEVVSA
jgi:hypothetical protein